ncbi:uncharacterized protein LOC135246920 [Anguilla rostrata]|uniref:uncharacterized protein LOC135246920 n=1 Tax=Anguilla rostrata TaxID=7938 RepID=UPI0030CB36D1
MSHGEEEDSISEISHVLGEDESEKGTSNEARYPVGMRVVGSHSPVPSALSMQTDHSKGIPPDLSKVTEPMESSVRNWTGLVETHLHLHSPKRSGDTTCDVCREEKARAVKFCQTCSAFYCEAHIRDHYTAEALQGHKLEEITEDLVSNPCIQKEAKHHSISTASEQVETQSPVADAQSLHQNCQKQERMCKPTSIFQKESWIKGLPIYITFGCVLAMTLLFIICTPKESGRRPASHDLRIVLVGKSGAGKSATGNTILGREVFKQVFSPVAVTLKCETHSGVVAGRNVTVIDTPGIFDIYLSNDKIKCEMVESINHLFLVVIRLGRFTVEERDTPKWIQENFGGDALQYSMVLFTGGDKLSTPVEEFLRKSIGLQEIINSCGGGYHVFNNKDKNNRTQVTELLEKIEAVLFKMTGYHHATMMIQQVQRQIQAEEERKREKSEREIRAEEERKRKESEREIRAEEKRKREESERKIRTEEERKREESEREIRAEEDRKRKETSNSAQFKAVLMVLIGVILTVVITVVFGKHKIQNIEVKEIRKREETERKIRAEEERKREEAEQEIRAEEKRKREKTKREIRTEEERKRKETEREIREEEERKRKETEREIRAEEDRKREETAKKIRAEEERKREEAEREIRAEEERKRKDTEREIRAEEERKRKDTEREIRAEEERKRKDTERETKEIALKRRQTYEREMREEMEEVKRNFGAHREQSKNLNPEMLIALKIWEDKMMYDSEIRKQEERMKETVRKTIEEKTMEAEKKFRAEEEEKRKATEEKIRQGEERLTKLENEVKAKEKKWLPW